PVEVVGAGVDGDGDGVVNEVFVEDITATVIYVAGQTRPHTELELDSLRRELESLGPEGAELARELELPLLTVEERRTIRRGREVFEQINCDACHVPQMRLRDTVFREPSENPNFNQDARDAGLTPADTVSFDLAVDMLDNRIEVPGRFFRNLANLEVDDEGRGVVRLYSDLKRHDMGPGLAESIDESGHGSAVWMTKELWGIGATGQYLHDGRATTIPEAILEHGGEAEGQAAAFRALPLEDQRDLVRFLQNLVILKVAED
ncbi:MAG: di-heme oxidoredictase family protein, partial [Pseudomonadota bacterium]